MAASKKVPGLLKDPWRTQPTAPPPEVKNTPRVKTSKPEVTGAVQAEDELKPQERACIEIAGYGGIIVEGVNSVPAATIRLLEFCIDHRSEIEKTFTEFGVVIAQLPVAPMPNLKFYVQRKDGWLLAIPAVPTREAGCFQLIQAMTQLQTSPALKKKLESYKIRPYKV